MAEWARTHAELKPLTVVFVSELGEPSRLVSDLQVSTRVAWREQHAHGESPVPLPGWYLLSAEQLVRSENKYFRNATPASWPFADVVLFYVPEHTETLPDSMHSVGVRRLERLGAVESEARQLRLGRRQPWLERCQPWLHKRVLMYEARQPRLRRRESRLARRWSGRPARVHRMSAATSARSPWPAVVTSRRRGQTPAPHFRLADGAVRFAIETIEHALYIALSTKRGAVVPLCRSQEFGVRC